MTMWRWSAEFRRDFPGVVVRNKDKIREKVHQAEDLIRYVRTERAYANKENRRYNYPLSSRSRYIVYEYAPEMRKL